MILAEFTLSLPARNKDSSKFTHQVMLVIDELREGVWDAQSYVYLEKGTPIHTDDDEGVVTDSPEFSASSPGEAQAKALGWLRTILSERFGCPVENIVLGDAEWEKWKP